MIERHHIFASVATIVVLLCPSTLTSQEPTFGVDGETWVQIDTTDFGRLQKLILLRGVYDGLLFGRSPEINLYPPNVAWNTLIAGLDQFYSDFANRKILVVWALQVLRVQITGEP